MSTTFSHENSWRRAGESETFIQLKYGSPVWKEEQMSKPSSVHANQDVRHLHNFQLLTKIRLVSERDLQDREA